MRRHRWGIVAVAALGIGTACWGPEAEPPDPPAPPTALPIIVSDTAAPAAPAIETRTAADTTQDLRDALAGLRDEVAALRTLVAPPPSAPAPPDSATTPSAEQLAQGAVEDVRFLGIRVFWSMVVLALAYYLIRTSVFILDQLAERTPTRRLLFKRLVPVVRLAVWVFAVYYIIGAVFQIDRTSLLAATAAIGVAVGFAAQDVLKNIFGGFIIILDRPFQVGDKIRVDNAYGEVVSIGLRATRIVTPDDNLVSVPNLKVVESAVANANAGALDCQVVVDLFLPGWIDANEAKRIAYDAAASSRYVYLDKPIVVNVKDEFRETFLTHLLVKAYVLDTRHEFAMASDITETAKAAFRERGMLPPIISRLAPVETRA